MLTNTIKIHIILKQEINDLDLAEIISIGKLTNINLERIKSFDIISCDTTKDYIDKLKILPQVLSIEIDDIKNIITKNIERK